MQLIAKKCLILDGFYHLLGVTKRAHLINLFFVCCFSVKYENQAEMFGKWGTTGLVGRYNYSDVTGKIKLKQKYFLPPRGWEWEGEWFVDPQKR